MLLTQRRRVVLACAIGTIEPLRVAADDDHYRGATSDDEQQQRRAVTCATAAAAAVSFARAADDVDDVFV